jgi:3-deoxy-D-manno-octulosonate 8-phosphate phosphatase (KDO 8-P phosphatase)
MAHYSLESKDVAYVGDDLNDLGVFKLVGLSVCPADALRYVKDQADLVTFAKGGKGVFREVADLVLAAQGKLSNLLG